MSAREELIRILTKGNRYAIIFSLTPELVDEIMNWREQGMREAWKEASKDPFCEECQHNHEEEFDEWLAEQGER